jgi:hypothetical protein
VARRRRVASVDPWTVAAFAISGGLLSYAAYHTGRSHQGEEDRKALMALVSVSDESTPVEQKISSFAKAS